MSLGSRDEKPGSGSGANIFEHALFHGFEMIDRLIADALVVAHTLFVLFVVLGSFLVIRWRWLAWFHVPTAVWGAVIEFAGWICPLTPLEKEFRRRAGEGGYEGGFVEHYLLGWLYPEGLTRETQIWLGLGVIVINAIGYSLAIMRWRRSASRSASGGDESPR